MLSVIFDLHIVFVIIDYDPAATTNELSEREFNESMEDVSSESSSKLWESSGSQK